MVQVPSNDETRTIDMKLQKPMRATTCLAWRNASNFVPTLLMASLLTLLLALGATAQTTANTIPTQAPPNFLFILADDQSWAGLSVEMIAGKDFSKGKNFNTPNTEKLAERGMIFSQAYAAHPKCECSRAAILAGRTTTTLNANKSIHQLVHAAHGFPCQFAQARKPRVSRGAIQ